MPEIRNLRQEILAVLEANDRTLADVRWVGAHTRVFVEPADRSLTEPKLAHLNPSHS